MRRPLLPMLVGFALAGCSTPYGGRLAIDYDRPQIGGSITVSDAKLYRREALINERRREVRYIDQLMANTEKDGFVIGPEIARELEVIRSIAVTAGLSFDPAAGAGYRGTERTASIRQDIDALQLQLQLDQLKRDATLFREKLDTQTAPSRDNLGAPTAAVPPAAAPTLTPADTADLIARVDALQATLAGRLGATVAGPRSVTLQGNPIDQFRDRAAYRQVLTTARNAASLDELHDIDGAALYRLTFQGTTLPPAKDYLRTAGIVEMQPIENSKPSPEEVEDIYLRWLGFINQSLLEANASPSGGSVDSVLLASQMFSQVQLLYDPGPVVAKPAPAAKKGKKAAAPPAAPRPACPGLVSNSYPTPAGCASVSFVAPDLPASSSSFVGDNRTMGLVLDRDFNDLENRYNEALALMRAPWTAAALMKPRACELRPESERRQLPPGPQQDADTALGSALSAMAAVPLLAQSLDRMVQTTSSGALRTAINVERVRLAHVAERARNVLAVLGAGQCGGDERLSPPSHVAVPARFRALVSQPTQVRVYEVGPREQVQQTSTAARAAEAFSLAAAVSAQVPSAGAAGKAGLGYSRSAIGKVDIIERQPLVVGYAQAGGKWKETAAGAKVAQPRFGWLLGPRVNSVDPKRGALELQQGQKIYDLSADLSVNGWRTQLPLAVRTAWSPDWRSRDFVSAMDTNGPHHVVTVELNPSPSEFAMLTQQLGFGLIGRGQRLASITRLSPLKVKACMAATLVLQGDNLWRATDVIIGGQRLGGDSLAVLPDMRGVTVELPAKTNFADISDQRVDVQVLTPYGVVHSQEELTIDGYEAKGCEKADVPAEGPAVTSVSPDVANVCSSPDFELTGIDLDKLTKVRFGASEGALAAASAKAKQRNVKFTREQLATIGTEVATMSFFAGEKPAGAGRAVRLVARNCEQKDN